MGNATKKLKNPVININPINISKSTPLFRADLS